MYSPRQEAFDGIQPAIETDPPAATIATAPREATPEPDRHPPGLNPTGPTSPSGRTDWLHRLLPLLTVFGLLAVVQLFTATAVFGGQFPTVFEVAAALTRELNTQLFWQRLAETFAGWFGGFAIAAALAVPLGLVIAANDFVFRSTRLVIDVLRPIPPVAVLPLAVLLIGTGTDMKIGLVAFSAFWPILFQVVYGAHDVDPVARDSTRAYGLNRMQQYRHVVLPSATPYIATGLRVASSVALIVTIATELIVGSAGLGYEINQVRYADNVPAMYALIFVAGLLGWLATVLFSAGERRLLHWHHSHREVNS